MCNSQARSQRCNGGFSLHIPKVALTSLK